jgi:hypothetical protein
MSTISQYLNKASKNEVYEFDEVYGFDNINELKQRLSEIKTEDFRTRMFILTKLKDIKKNPNILNTVVELVDKEKKLGKKVNKLTDEINIINKTKYENNLLLKTNLEKALKLYSDKFSELQNLLSNNNNIIINIYEKLKI